MAPNRTQVIARNVASNWLGFGVNVVVTLFLTPYVLEHLGDARYGVWVLTVGLTGYYGLLDLGFRGGVTQFLTRHLAEGDMDRVNESASSAVVALSGVGAAIFLVSVVVGAFATSIFEIPPDISHEVFGCIVIAGASAALQSVFFSFSAVFTATQRLDVANAIGIATRLLYAAFVLAAIDQGYGLVGLSAAVTAAHAVDYAIRWRVAYRLLPGLSVRWSRSTSRGRREIMSFGVWNFLISVSTSIFQYADSLVVGIFLPVAALAPYGLAANVSRYVSQLLLPVNRVFYPAATELHAQKDVERLRQLFIDGSRLYLLLAFVTCAATALWAEAFFRLWVGDRFVSGEEYPSVATLYQLLVLGVAATAFPGVGGQVLLGAMKVQILAKLAIVQAIANVILSVILVQRFGLVGVAYGTVLSVVLFRSIPGPYLACREVGLPVTAYLVGACLRPTLAAVVLYYAVQAATRLGEPATMIELGLRGAASLVVAVPVALAIGTTRADRTRYVYAPIRAALRRRAKPDAAA